MARDLYRSPRLSAIGRRKPVKSKDLQNATLRAGDEITVWSDQVAADTVLFHGYGDNNRQSGTVAPIYAKLLATGNGTGADGDAIEGDLVAVITDSEGRDVLARKEVGDLETLADAEADPRTERPLFPAQGPAAGEDKNLELRVIADPASDGNEVASDSSLRYYYGKASV